ncbi:hypothetical protein G6F36_012313 [Rhizopus arrhizus]|nr:hypothetical protein G6F36_012313 [Rhizopus arrhizus]
MISPRNSEPAIVNLLEKTKSKLFFASTKFDSLAQESTAQCDGVKLVMLDPFDIEDRKKQPLHPQSEEILNMNFTTEDINEPVLIIHSSGTTNFPKPIYLSNKYIINSSIFFEYYKTQKPNLDLLNKDDVALPCAPLFHMFGFSSLTTVTLQGASLVFLEKLPPSQAEIDFALRQNKVTVMSAAPIILEQMIPFLKERNDFSAVRRLKYIIFGGASMKHESGEWFHKHQINIRNGYGSTEGGMLMMPDMDPSGKNWYALRPVVRDEEGKFFCVLEDIGDGLKHLYIRAGNPNFALGVSNRPDGGYNTSDIFRDDPDFPGHYNYVGRLDDTLIMENGEKTNPVPMENTIRLCPIVKQVAVVGQGRQCTAALIELNMEEVVSYGPQEMTAIVQEAVDEANKECPSHSTILPEMIKILPFNKSLPSTDKGTVKRKLVESSYQDVIEDLYKAFLDGPRTKAYTTLSPAEIEPFLIKSLAEVLHLPESSIDPSLSVFELGLNSLTAIQLRNMVASRLGGDIPQNFLFQYPTISSMREALVGGLKKKGDSLGYGQTELLAQSYIERARSEFPVAKDSGEEREKVILLTGATGSLGSFILRDLLKDRRVKKVYCLVRGTDLRQRLVQSFVSRHLDPTLLSTDRLEVLPMRLAEPYLGLTKEVYDQLKKEVTIIQHCAWLLDFNMSIGHYDKACIAPFYNLIRFAYREVNPMQLHFISSVSASAGLGPQVEEKALPMDARAAILMGYAQSKFVCESLLTYLAQEKHMPCSIERVGQVCGDSVNGVWNTSEQFPLVLVAGGSLLHKMPRLESDVDWIPVDYAATAIVNIMLHPQQEESVYHIVNPATESWSDLLEAMRSCGMQFDTVDPPIL